MGILIHGSCIAIYRVSGGESPVMRTPDSRGCESRGANGGTKASTTSAGLSLVTRQPLLTHPTSGVSSGSQVGGVVCCLQHVLNICMPTKMSRVDATAAAAACQGPRVSRKTILHSPRAGSQRFTSPSLRSGSNQVNIIIRSQ